MRTNIRVVNTDGNTTSYEDVTSLIVEKTGIMFYWDDPEDAQKTLVKVYYDLPAIAQVIVESEMYNNNNEKALPNEEN